MTMAKRICAWCKAIMGYRDDIDRDTHGICDPCMKKELAEARAGKKT